MVGVGGRKDILAFGAPDVADVGETFLHQVDQREHVLVEVNEFVSDSKDEKGRENGHDQENEDEDPEKT